ncbi:MAG: sugar ABC transporter substrate-binding protein [Gammaproteobacteria bacterium]|nr:sugar ABC transporter substrate-binding protein [Gammaproteobacteria bacterium]
MKNFILYSLIFVLFACSLPNKKVASDKEVEIKQSDESVVQNYTIGSGDTLDIFVWRNSELSTSVPVRPDGKISIPLVEDISAAGKAPAQLARDIEKGLKKFIRDPMVTVIVTNFVGTYENQIKVIGAAMVPQSLPYKNGMALLDVIIAVGGLNEFADGNKAKIIRYQGKKQVEMAVRIEDLIQQGDLSSNVKMLPGDVLVIPEAWL